MAARDAQLSTLVSLIANATKIVEKHYQATSKPYVPSLEDTEPHPLDDKISDPELRNAIQTIEGACAQLTASVARPNHTVFDLYFGAFVPNCLKIVLRHKISDILKDKPQGLHINEIGAKTNLDPKKIGRVLRLLATRHVYREVSEDVFANNRLSLQLLSSNPLSATGHHLTEEATSTVGFLADVLGDKEWGKSYSPRQTALNKLTGKNETLFEFFESLGPELGHQFAIQMIGWSNAMEAGNVVYEYPWDKLPKGASVVDVAGGVGAVAMQIAKVHPHLQVKLQDLPERVLQAKNEIWPKECPEAIAENRIQFEPLDFFNESPIAGCDVYFLKNIIHDWADAESITILKGVRKAMAPHSRVVIHEHILQHVNRVQKDSSGLAPEPLLPNYGVGRLRKYIVDIEMMAFLNAQERFLEDFINLAKQADLEYVRSWDFGQMAAVEFKIASA